MKIYSKWLLSVLPETPLFLMNKILHPKKKKKKRRRKKTMLSPTAPLLTAQCAVIICITFAFGDVNFIKMPHAKIKIYSVASSALISPLIILLTIPQISTP